MIPDWWPVVAQAAQDHARNGYPNEVCGVVINGEYRPLINRHPDPTEDFECTDQVLDHILDGDRIEALIHSHPNGVPHPTKTDMAQQMQWDFPWGLVPFDGEEPGRPYLWGAGVADDVPLLGRPFRFGPTGTDGAGDCGALIRDFYRVRYGITLRDYPRDIDWIKAGLEYRACLLASGFAEVADDSVQDGDVVLMRVRSTGGRHAGVYRDPGMILHHPAGRLSCEEPIIAYLQHVIGWFRHAERSAHPADPSR